MWVDQRCQIAVRVVPVEAKLNNSYASEHRGLQNKSWAVAPEQSKGATIINSVVMFEVLANFLDPR